jgi:hypothetical protein
MPTFPYPLGYGDRLRIAEWLWVNAVFHLYGSELINLRILLAQSFVVCYSQPDNGLHDRVSEILVKLMDFEMIELYKGGAYPLLPGFFADAQYFYGHCSFDSKYTGRRFLQLLARLGVDVQTCVRREIDSIPHSSFFSLYLGHRNLIFERLEDGMVLRWEWKYDTTATGYLVVAEFSTLAGDANPNHETSQWPFTDFDCLDHGGYELSERIYEFKTSKQIARFERRATTKARKERVRMGQKRPRSRMPGAWI